MAQTGVAATKSVDRSSPAVGAPHAADDRAAALAAARQAAALLVERYGARRVYLFGSLAGTGSALFQPASDIDLAGQALDGEVYVGGRRSMLWMQSCHEDTQPMCPRLSLCGRISRRRCWSGGCCSPTATVPPQTRLIEQ